MQLMNGPVDPLTHQEGRVGMLPGSTVPGERASSVIVNGIKLTQGPPCGIQDSDHKPGCPVRTLALPFASYGVLR